MSFKLDTKKFKKISADKTHTILQHADGHQLKIAHGALSAKLRGQLAELPEAKADGGVAGKDKADFSKGASESYFDAAKKLFSDDKPAPKAAPQGNSGFGGPTQGRAPKQAPQNFYDGGAATEKDKKDFSKAATSSWFGADTSDKPAEKPKEKEHPPATMYGGATYGKGPKHVPENWAMGTTPESGAVGEQQPEEAPTAPEAPQVAAPTQAPVTINLNTGAPPAPGPSPAVAPPEQQSHGSSGSWGGPPPQLGNPGAPPQMAPQGEAPQQALPPQATPAQPDTFGANAQAGALEHGIQEQKAGIFGEANALGAQGKAEANQLAVANIQQQEIMQTYHDHMKALDTERANFIQDYKNEHIEPHHYLNNMGTGQRIATTIGLILGGFGALAGQPNFAAEMLQKNIDRDIEGQKMKLGRAENLLSANMKQYGNLRDATEMTRAMQNDIVSTQLKQAAARTMDPLAKARALQTAGQLDQSTAGTIGQLTMRRTLLTGAKNGQIAPEKVVNFLVPENQRGEANKELKEAQEAVAARDNALAGFDAIAKMNTVGNRTMNPLQSKRQIEAIRGPLVASLSKATAGKFTEQDAHMLDALFSGAGESAETQATKRAQLVKLIGEKMHYPILSTYGIDVNNMGRFGGTGQASIPEGAPVTKKK